MTGLASFRACLVDLGGWLMPPATHVKGAVPCRGSVMRSVVCAGSCCIPGLPPQPVMGKKLHVSSGPVTDACLVRVTYSYP